MSGKNKADGFCPPAPYISTSTSLLPCLRAPALHAPTISHKCCRASPPMPCCIPPFPTHVPLSCLTSCPVFSKNHSIPLHRSFSQLLGDEGNVLFGFFFSLAVQEASWLARLEPSSEGKKSTSKTKVSRSLAKPLTDNTALALCHVCPCCAVYRLPACSCSCFWAIKMREAEDLFLCFVHP